MQSCPDYASIAFAFPLPSLGSPWIKSWHERQDLSDVRRDHDFRQLVPKVRRSSTATGQTSCSNANAATDFRGARNRAYRRRSRPLVAAGAVVAELAAGILREQQDRPQAIRGPAK